MVTVGDKIAWWCLDHLPRKKASSIRARKTSVSADTYNPFQRRRRTSESNVAVISPGKIFFLKSYRYFVGSHFVFKT